jgi:hypothetical protein
MARPHVRPLARGSDAAPDLPLVYGDFPCRVQRWMGLMPAHGLGVGRRAVVAVLVTWVPLALAALWAGRFLEGDTAEPLLRHFGLNVKLLVAVPVLIVGEVLLERLTRKKIPHFVESGLVTEADRPAFAAIVARAAAWHDAWKPWLVIAVLAAAWTMTPGAWSVHELIWTAVDPPPGQLALRFGGWWYIFVARPVFIALVLIWLWRLGVFAVLLVQISRLPLSLVPTHPDKAGGLGFLSELPHAFSPLTLALAAVLAAHWGHAALYHGVELESFTLPLVAFTIVTTVAVLAPMLAFVGPLVALRRREKLRYGALVGEYGRLVHERWILGEPVRDDTMFTARELGPAADAGMLYDQVERTRPVPFNPRTLVMIVAPILLPMVPLIAVEIHLVDALKVVLSTLK